MLACGGEIGVFFRAGGWRVTAASADVLDADKPRASSSLINALLAVSPCQMQAPSLNHPPSSRRAYTALSAHAGRCKGRCRGRCKDTSNTLRNSARPRDRRDITVPMAVPVVWAISR